MSRPPLPPFTAETAAQKVRAAEDAWNRRDPRAVSLAYTPDSRWRNRSEFLNGRAEIVGFLERKWAKELDYRLIKELWAFEGDRIAVRFAYEWRDETGSGSGPTGTRTGSSMPRATWPSVTPASTTCRSPSPSGFSVGRMGRVRRNILACLNLDCRSGA